MFMTKNSENNYNKIYRHIPTNITYKFRIKEKTGMSVIYETKCGVEFWKGFLVWPGCKDWEHISGDEESQVKLNKTKITMEDRERSMNIDPYGEIF